MVLRIIKKKWVWQKKDSAKQKEIEVDANLKIQENVEMVFKREILKMFNIRAS